MNKLLFPAFGIFLLIMSSCQKYEPVTNPSDIYGSWGGESPVMVIGPEGATLEYDCATGTINEPILPYAKGTFQVTGTHNASLAE